MLVNSERNDEVLAGELAQLKQSLNDITQQFLINRASFSESISQLVEQLMNFLGILESQLNNDHHCKTIILHRLPYVKQATRLSQPEPTVSEVISLLTQNKGGDRQPQLSPDITDILTQVLPMESMSIPQDHSSGEHPPLSKLPQPLNDALQTLAYFAQRRSDTLRSGVQSLKQELAEWFRRSLSQAQRVDRRNRIGVSLLISLMIAIVANVDLFYLLNRFTNDPSLRTTLEQTADSETSRSLLETIDPLDPPEMRSPQLLVETLNTTHDAVDENLQKLPFPLGWQTANLVRQTALYPEWLPTFFGQCLGWGVSGLLIATGASLWYTIRF